MVAAKLPPGPRGHWLYGSLQQLRADPLALYMSSWRQYGDYVRLRFLPGLHALLLVHPDAVEHVLQANNKNYLKPGLVINPVKLLTGNGLFTSEGTFWLRQRRLIQPAFHRQKLAGLVPLMSSAVDAFVRERRAAPAGQVVDVVKEMMRLALRIAGLTLFSTDIAGDADITGNAYRTAFSIISYRSTHRFAAPMWVPTRLNLEFKRARRILDDVVLRLIQARRQASAKPDDLLTLLLAAQDEETGIGMSDEQLRDETMTLLTAGHETTGAALAWTWYLLALHPQIQEDVADEARACIQGRSPTADDLPHLPLTRAVFEETMRLYPPAWGVPRQAIADDEINGFAIPRGEIIALPQFLTHRHPEFWPEPERFQPDRFLGNKSERRPKFAYYPFGAGPRVCIGNMFAMMEATVALASIAQHFRIELVPGQTVLPDPTFTLRPRGAVNITMWPR